MKFKTLFLLIVVLCTNVLCAQKELHYSEYNHVNINVRSDIPFALSKVELDIKKKGKVIVTMEGTCQSAAGDQIIFGVSNGLWWFTDYGNVGVQVFDTLQNQNHYFHTMSFDVTPEKHTFSAFAHNWTDRRGTGIISVKGKLIVEFIPEEEQQLHVYKNISKFPFAINNEESIIDSLSIITIKPAKTLFTFNGRFYSKPETEVLVVLNNKPTMENGLDSFILSTHDLNRYPEFSIKVIQDLNIGNHQFYVMTRKLKGEFSGTENAFYSTLTASTYDTQNVQEQIILQKQNTTTQGDKKIQTLDVMNISIPAKGKIMVSVSGFIDLKKSQKINIGLETNQQKTRYSDSIKISLTHPEDNQTFFTMNQIYDVAAGPLRIDLKSSDLETSLKNLIQSDLLIKYIGENVISSSQETAAFNEDVFVYPNPTSGTIHLGGEKDWKNDPKKINLFDLQGNPLILNLSKDENNQLDISQLQNGKYLLKIHDGSNYKVIQIIKAN